MENERWALVLGFNGVYSVSTLGRVRNNVTDKLLKPCANSRGYYIVVLNNSGLRKTHTVHRLVATHFIITSRGKNTVNHVDGNKSNNKLSNLEWLSQSENQIHAYKIGLQKVSENQKLGAAKYAKENYSKPVIQTDLKGIIIKYFQSASEAARQTGFKQTHISSCCRGKVKTCHKYKFYYADKESHRAA